MTQHVDAWLEVYHDGELEVKRVAAVEAHLAGCEVCREKLARLQSLTLLLQEAPPAEVLTPDDRFVANLGLRLPRRELQPNFGRALRWGWHLLPLGLLVIWGFLHTLNQTAGIWGLVYFLDPNGSWVGDLFPLMADILSFASPLDVGATLNLVIPAAIGVLCLSWSAAWWALQRSD